MWLANEHLSLDFVSACGLELILLHILQLYFLAGQGKGFIICQVVESSRLTWESDMHFNL